MHIIGNLSLIAGIILSLYSIVANIVGIRTKNEKWLDSARGGTLGVLFVSCIASYLLFYFLATNQFQIKYVASYSSYDLPMIYKLTAFWAGNAGSLLLWTLLLSIYTVIVAYFTKRKNPLVPYATGILLLNLLFFFIVLVMMANPFEITEMIPPDGKGLNPMLQNPGMVIHPVTLYMGYVGLAVPFAFGIAAMMIKTMDSGWIKLTRKWTLTAWLFLTLGNLIGGWWAYVELGWGGYWAWDAVENASFLPWLTVSAFLHSVMIQERKNMLKTWNISLISLSYILSIFGTFLVRSGILTSVHAFADSGLGTYFFIFLSFMLLLTIYIIITRYKLIKKQSVPIETYFSKETSFLLNNLILVAAAFAVFWGTMYPLISEVLTGTKVNVGAPYFNKVMAPIMLSLILLMAICPLISWQKASFRLFLKNLLLPTLFSCIFACILYLSDVKGFFAILGLASTVFMFTVHILEFVKGTKARMKAAKEPVLQAAAKLLLKNQRRYGGYIVHIGIAVIAIGIISSNAYSKEVLKTVKQGESISIGDFKLKFNHFGKKEGTDRDVVYADLAVSYKGKKIGQIQPEKIFYDSWPEPSTEVAVITHWNQDLYAVFSSWETKKKITLLIKVNPFVSWIWAGGFIMVIGIAVALFGGKPYTRQINPWIRSMGR